jgi:MoaA/NifB/PqqE/SkfB family radical SAM enzyme
MTLKTYERISENFPEINNIYLSGWGEPLLNPHFHKMTKLSKEAGCTVGFTTNGSHLGINTIRQLIYNQVDLVSISFAGATSETHDAKRIGSKFDEVINKIKQIQNVKNEYGSENPRILFLFMMFRDNLNELPKAIELSKQLGTGSIVATNLDYIGNVSMDKMKAFSCKGANKNKDEIISDAKKMAEELKVKLTVFPLSLGSTRLCTEDPLKNLYISEDGSVAPCVYLCPPMSNIPRIFCGKEDRVYRTYYGNINEKSLNQIWDSEAYIMFRAQLEDVSKGTSITLPDVCKTCYKAYGL